MHHFRSETAAGPRFEAFLQAPIGCDRHGMPISVRTAMARLGVDPRGEAERMAGLPRAAAAGVLVRFIENTGTRPESEIRGTAERLVRLLPSTAPAVQRPVPPDRRALMIAVLLALLALVLMISYWRGSWPQGLWI